MAVRVTVVGQYDGKPIAIAQRDVNRLATSAKKAQGSFSQLASGFKSHFTPNLALAGAAVAAFAVKLGVDAVKAAAAEQVAIERLDQALINANQSMNLDGVETFIDGMARSTGVADDMLRPAMIQLVNATQDTTKAQDLLSLALDISAGSGRDLTAVTTALSRAALGQTTALRRLGVPLSDAAVKSKDLGTITAELTGTFRGQAARAAGTYQGQVARLGVAFGELQEALGTGFLDGINSSEDSTRDLTSAMQDLEPIVSGLGESIGTQVQGLGDLAAIFSLIDTNSGDAEGGLRTFFETAKRFNPSVFEFFSMLRRDLEGAGVEFVDLAETHDGYRDAAVRAHDATLETADGMTGLEEETSGAAEALDTLNREMKTFFGFLDQRDALRGYAEDVDNLRKSLKENGKTFDINTEAGRDNQAALDAVFDSALDVADGQATAAEKIATMEGAARDAAAQLDKTKMSDAAKQALLQPFDDAIWRFRTSVTEVDNLKAAMEKLPTNLPIKINVTVGTTYVGTPPPGGLEFPASGGMIGGRRSLGRGSDIVPAMLTPGEFVIRRQAVKQFGTAFFSQLNQGINPTEAYGAPGPSGGSPGGGFSIGTLNVTSAPGERAEETVPRALRRMAFLAGV
jgi:hypothetical protein